MIPVAGVREKASAAHRVGIRTVIFPKGNEKNLLDLPEKIRKETHFIFVERIEEVLKLALLEPDESQRDIEAILRREFGKLVKRNKKGKLELKVKRQKSKVGSRKKKNNR